MATCEMASAGRNGFGINRQRSASGHSRHPGSKPDMRIVRVAGCCVEIHCARWRPFLLGLTTPESGLPRNVVGMDTLEIAAALLGGLAGAFLLQKAALRGLFRIPGSKRRPR